MYVVIGGVGCGEEESRVTRFFCSFFFWTVQYICFLKFIFVFMKKTPAKTMLLLITLNFVVCPQLVQLLLQSRAYDCNEMTLKHSKLLAEVLLER